MKPSERIKQIESASELRWPNDVSPRLNVIIQYLDEEYEKNQLSANIGVE